MTKRNEAGAALIVSLVMLLLMTMIGIFAMRTSIMEEKMAANQIDRDIAFEAAEIALREAELQILSWSDFPLATDDGSYNGVWTRDSMDPVTNNATPWWIETDEAWWKNNNNSMVANKPSEAIDAPRYVIEEVYKDRGDLESEPNEGTKKFYRVTARGIGASAQARVLLQSTVVLRF
ncbi:pilus assembly PilX family protein [Methylophaga sulfidovorans]|uniref:Type IV pilus assembly protein PilX n=1 Tax=Methylophaga sulfidovorans TaxID=45496 RepID=A0A1I3WVR7_9GAMM|nr:PilX N-terminal domain-containing pilus assembly protein [Methylophaga sulfidovorans]SFK11410.1 type IV pilus assembly protein PilX [Methylophaga sulfidovorans]